MKRKWLFFIPLGLALPVFGQPSTGSKPETPVSKLTVDWSVPESPAFTVLGATPQTITKPSSPQQLVTTLLNGVDQSGNFQTGVAFDVQPYLLTYGHKVRYRDYFERKGLRFLSRIQTSFGTTKGATDDDKSVRMALGFRFTLFDFGDQYLNEKLAGCIADAQLSALRSVPPPPPGDQAAQEKFKNDLLKAVAPLEKACRDTDAEEYRKSRWNDSSMVIGVAPSWISPTGSTDDLMWNGGGVWLSYAYGFENLPGLEDSSQLILHYRYRDKEQIPDQANQGSFLEQDSSVAGVRWRLGTADTTGSFEFVYLHRDIRNMGKDDSWRFSLGAERKLAGNIWLVISFGSERGRMNGDNNAFVLTTFNWNLNRKE